MSESSTAVTTETETTATESQETETTKPTETVEFWKSKAREQEKRAKDNANAAKRLAEIEEAQKSEAEKSADRIKALEGEAASAKRDALRFKVASKYGIGDEDADLFLTGSDEESLTKQAERLAARTQERKKQGNRVLKEGTSTTSSSTGEDAEREFVRDLFGRAKED